MPPSRRLDPDQLLAAIRAQEDVLRGADLEVPTALDPDRRIVEAVAAGLRAGVDADRSALRFAVRVLADRLAARHPGRSVEVRVPPFAAVQCIAGPRHTRGTPPNVVETDPATFIGLACGFVSWDAATADGRVRASGERLICGRTCRWMCTRPTVKSRSIEYVRRTPVTGSPITSLADSANPDSAAGADDLNDDPGPRDACGVFGAFARSEEVAKLAYYGLYALQHRGQEAAGIAVSDGSSIVVYKELGLVSQVFDEVTLGSLTGHIAVGHTRYSTTGSCTWENAQPSYRSHDRGGIALGHNGNLTNTAAMAERLARLGGGGAVLTATTDSELITGLLASSPLGLEKAALDVLPLLEGAFCLVFCDESTLCAARDAHGIHPLVLGRLGPAEAPTGWVVASETAALDIVGAVLVREVEAGEMLVIDDDGVRSHRFATATPHGCIFEYVYLARPDTTIAGRSVHATRVEVGRALAREAPADGDLVIPVPDSGTPAAIGYAEQSGIPYGAGWSRTPMSAARSSSRRRPSASSGSASSSTRCAR